MICSFENMTYSKKVIYLLRKHEILYQRYDLFQTCMHKLMSLEPVSGLDLAREEPFAPKPSGSMGPMYRCIYINIYTYIHIYVYMCIYIWSEGGQKEAA